MRTPKPIATFEAHREPAEREFHRFVIEHSVFFWKSWWQSLPEALQRQELVDVMSDLGLQIDVDDDEFWAWINWMDAYTPDAWFRRVHAKRYTAVYVDMPNDAYADAYRFDPWGHKHKLIDSATRREAKRAERKRLTPEPGA